jgi:hypothetical protein
MSTFVEPNTYELNDFHGDLHVAFFPHSGPLPGSSRNHRVTYHDRITSKEFLGAAVQVVPTNIGRLVTVILRQTIDAGSTSFSFLVPRVNLLVDGSPRAPIETEGITTTHRLSPVHALNRGQRDVYTVIPLVGTASLAVVSYPPPPGHPSSAPPGESPRTPVPPSPLSRRR